MRASALLLLLATLGAGCMECQQQLDIKHCIDGQSGCPPVGAYVSTWTTSHTNNWPDVAELMLKTPEGTHSHADWNGDRAELLDDLGWNGGDPEMFVRFGGDVYRIRVLVCE